MHAGDFQRRLLFFLHQFQSAISEFFITSTPCRYCYMEAELYKGTYDLCQPMAFAIILLAKLCL